jgi:hypothetical protein
MEHDDRIFNYRLSRARRVVENAFGILANRFHVLLGMMEHDPETVTLIVDACVCLHNLMRTRYPGEKNERLDLEDELGNVIRGEWRDGVQFEDVNGPAVRGNIGVTTSPQGTRETNSVHTTTLQREVSPGRSTLFSSDKDYENT